MDSFDPMIARDLAVLWHPCTQMREHPAILPLVPIARGEGAWLVGMDGKRYLDAVSSWWTNLFGHAEPRIARAIAEQAGTLEQVILAGFTHEPAVALAERLLALAPREDGRAPLAKVFYADNGSAGVEVALKMAFHWFRNQGQPQRTKFIALENGYHGETIGALAVGDIPLVSPRVCAAAGRGDLRALARCVPGARRRDAGRLRRARGRGTARHPRTPRPRSLRADPRATRAMRRRHAHARSGVSASARANSAMRTACSSSPTRSRWASAAPARVFACEQAGIQPDLMCLSKGLTGGFLPLAAVLATQAIYDGFLDDSRERAFLHSHSYTGNPLACAAALRAQAIFDEDDVLVRNRATAARMTALAASVAESPHVADARQAGMILAFELTKNGDKATPFDAASRVGLHAYRKALELGVVLRPLGDILYWMPPYCIDDDQLDLLARATREAILHATKDAA